MNTALKPNRFVLPQIEGVIWRLDFAALRDVEADLLDTLPAAETSRLAPLADKPRLRSLAGAVFAREELGRHLRLAPCDVPLERTRFGKPTVSSQDPEVHFSLAHAGEYLLFVRSSRSVLGADIETSRAYEANVARRFSASERRTLGGFVGRARARAFTRLWTAKEACVKCRGRGSISEVETTLASQGRWRNIHWRRVELIPELQVVVAAEVA